MRPEFEILPDEFDPSKTDLIFEVSDAGFCFFFQDHERKFVHGLSKYLFNTKTPIEEIGKSLSGLLDKEVLSGPFQRIIVSYSYKESLLLPRALFIDGYQKSMIRLMFGDLYESQVLKDIIEEKNIYNVYNIPQVFYKPLAAKFPAASFIHQHTVMITHLPLEGNIMSAIVYQNKIVVALVKWGKLQIVQSFYYETTEDALYHLLNTCHQFGVDEVELRLSGMIEKNSALYRQMLNYFLFIKFSEIPEGINIADGVKELPDHYFSHLFSICQCV